MQFTFGIVTNGNDLDKIIKSIYDLNIPKENYEILIVGSCKTSYEENIFKIPFDETIKSGWITRKKNLITINSTKENIVFLHDYVIFDKNWYNGYLEFGNDWDVCTNIQLNPSGCRFRDWVLHECSFDGFGFQGYGRLIPYDQESANYVYINGTYWIAKKHVMEKIPLDETRAWGESEDLAWTKAIKYFGCKIKFNQKSINYLLKEKDVVFTLMDDSFYESKFKPFIKNNEVNSIWFKRNMELYERTCSLLKPYLQENLSEKYIKKYDK